MVNVWKFVKYLVRTHLMKNADLSLLLHIYTKCFMFIVSFIGNSKMTFYWKPVVLSVINVSLYLTFLKILVIQHSM